MGKLRNMASVYLTDDEGVLMLYRIGSRVANNLYVGSAGGHFEPEEVHDAKACVLREMGEELGLRESDVEGMKLRYVTLRLKDGEIRQNYYFFGRLRERGPLESAEGKLQWVSYGGIGELEMPVSARFMMEHWLREGRYTDALYVGVTRQNGMTFERLCEF